MTLPKYQTVKLGPEGHTEVSDMSPAARKDAIAALEKGLEANVQELRTRKNQWTHSARAWWVGYFAVGGISIVAAAVAGVSFLIVNHPTWAGVIALVAAAFGALDKFLGAGKMADRKQALADAASEMLAEAEMTLRHEQERHTEYGENGYILFLRRKNKEFEAFICRSEGEEWKLLDHNRPSLVSGEDASSTEPAKPALTGGTDS